MKTYPCAVPTCTEQATQLVVIAAERNPGPHPVCDPCLTTVEADREAREVRP